MIKGMGELHLDIKVDRMRRDLQGRCQYRRAAGRLSRDDHEEAEIDYTHKKQTGGTGQFARVKIVVEPNEAGAGFKFEQRSSAGRCRRSTSPASRRASNRSSETGVVAGFPVVDVKVSLIDGAFHDVDSSALAFEIASRAALREGLQKGGSVLLEPIMKVEVVTPEDYTGSVIGDLNSAVVARSRVRTCAATRSSSTRWSRSPTCSATSIPALDEPGPRELHHAIRSLRAGAVQRGRRSQAKYA
jgi:elongation factor G